MASSYGSRLFARAFMLLSIFFIFVPSAGAQQRGAGAANQKALTNLVKATPESIAAGRQTYTKYCGFCHGSDARGEGPMAPKDTHPPDLTDATWTHGSTDGDMFVVIRDGIGPKFEMKPNKDKIPEQDIWNVVNYLRSLGGKR